MNAHESLVDIGYTKRQADKLLPSLFMYLFKGFHQDTLKLRAAELNPEIELFRFLSKVPLMGSITQDDKVCLYAKHRGVNPGIKAEPYIARVLANPEFNAHVSRFEGPAYSLSEVRKLEERALLNPEIELYIRKFLFRKMSFIIKNYGVPFEDLTESVQERAIHNLRMNYPNWKNSGEMLAMSKSAIANAGHNIIKFYAATKRAKLDKMNNAVEISMEAMAEVAGDGFEYTALVYSDVFERGMERIDAAMSLTSLMAKVTQPNKKLFLTLLGGKYDFGFSEYLGQDNTSYTANEDFEKLFGRACTYMGVTQTRASTFLKSLR